MTLRTLLLLAVCASPAVAEPAKKLLLVSHGPDGHPALSHEYQAGLKVLAKCLKDVPGLEVTTVSGDEPFTDGPDLLPRYDGVVLFVSEGAKWMQKDVKRFAALEKLAVQKGGLTVLHWAMGTKEAGSIEGCVKLLGGCHGGPDRKYQVLETEVRLADEKHPVATGLTRFKVKDEFYYRLKFAKPEGSVTPLVQAKIDGDWETVGWGYDRPDGGRSFGFSGLHFHDNWKLTEYRRLVAQGVLWTLRLPVPKEGLPVTVTEEDLKIK